MGITTRWHHRQRKEDKKLSITAREKRKRICLLNK
jgi:hypothetical protein